MGGAFKPFLGVINGYYELDLRKEMDALALGRLLEASQTENTLRQAQSPIEMGRMGDLSQCGTWTSFRNESLNGKRFAITPERFRPMPKSGKLIFDYSSVARPVVNEDLLVLTDARLVKILHNQFLIPEHDMVKAMKRLMLWRKHLKRANTAKGHMLHQYEYDKEKCLAMSEAIKNFYERLDERADCMMHGAERENVKVCQAMSILACRLNADFTGVINHNQIMLPTFSRWTTRRRIRKRRRGRRGAKRRKTRTISKAGTMAP